MCSENATGGIERQPVATVTWLHRDTLTSNDYNPNHAAPPEFRLLKTSILADGWTQPIVARRNFEIVDGFHRWKASADPEIYALTDGLVPVVFLSDEASEAHQRMSTIRHNRARGKHGIRPMAEIARSLVETHGVEGEELERLLGMEAEEVERLLDLSGMPSRGGSSGFNKGWVPTTENPYDSHN